MEPFEYFKVKGNKTVIMSDLHMGHDKEFLWKDRGFSSIQEHDDFIYHSWLSNIDSETTIINLGDVCFMDPKANKFRELLNLPFKKMYVINGNHNSGLKQFVQGGEVEEQSRLVYARDYISGWINNQSVTMFHYPIFIWDGKQNGSFCLSGHSHGTCSFTNPSSPDFGKLGRVIDCGVETALDFSSRNRFFWKWEEIRELLTKINFKESTFDHHIEGVTSGI